MRYIQTCTVFKSSNYTVQQYDLLVRGSDHNLGICRTLHLDNFLNSEFWILENMEKLGDFQRSLGSEYVVQYWKVEITQYSNTTYVVQTIIWAYVGNAVPTVFWILDSEFWILENIEKLVDFQRSLGSEYVVQYWKVEITQYSNTTYVVPTIIWAHVATIHDFCVNSIVQLRILLNSESELRIIQNSYCDTLMLYRKRTGTCKFEDRNAPFAPSMGDLQAGVASRVRAWSMDPPSPGPRACQRYCMWGRAVLRTSTGSGGTGGTPAINTRIAAVASEQA